MNTGTGALRAATRLIDRSGLADFFDARLARVKPNGDPDRRGRPRVLSVRTLLIGIALAAIDDRELHLVRIRRVLGGLSSGQADTLRIPRSEAARLAKLTDRQVSYLWCRMIDLIDPSPHFAHRQLASLDPDGRAAELARRETMLQEVLDRIVEASLDGDRTGSYALDWTFLPSWAKRRPRHKPSPDPDAGTVYIEGGLEPKHFLFGYQVHALVRIAAEGGRPVPNVCERILLQAAAANPAPTLARLITNMNRTEQSVRELLVDRGYSMKVADDWHNPLRRAGVELSFDLHENQRGPHGTTQGAVIADDGVFCPALPEALFGLERLDDFAEAAVRDVIFAEAARRDRFSLVQLGAEKPDGSRRCSCPAAAGKVRCPLKPDSMNLPYSRPTVYPDRTLVADPPKVCTQRTITIGNEVCDSTRQKHRWNTEDWYDAYKRRRRAVETFFSLIEDQGKQEMARGRVKIMGVARTSFMVAFWAAAVNLRVIGRFNTSTKHARVISLTRKPRRNRAVPFADIAAGKTAPSRAGP